MSDTTRNTRPLNDPGKSQEPDPLGAPKRRFKDPAYKELAANLGELRAAIDGIDEQCLTLLAQRAMLVKDAARFKADHYQVSAPQRQAEVYRKVRETAMRHNPGFEGFEDVMEQTWRTMVARFIAQESEYFDQLEPL